MKNTLSLLLLLALVGYILPIKTSAQPQVDQQVVSGVVMKNDSLPLPTARFLEELKKQWDIAPTEFSDQDRTLVFSLDSAVVMIASMDYAVPMTDWIAPAAISWLWKNARREVPQHRSQVVISVAGRHGQSVKLYQIFTKVAAAALATTASSGVFMPNQYLLISKNYYLESAQQLRESALPIYLWAYFGMVEEEGFSSCYTYGLSEFGLKEMEIVRTPRSVAVAHAVLYDAAQQTIAFNRKLKTGDEIAILNEAKVGLQVSKGVLLDEVETVKVLLK